MQVSDYQEVCDLVVDDLKDNPNIKSVYLAGSQWLPGISDLDIIVVFNDQIKDGFDFQSPWNLSKKAKYIFSHKYAIYNEKSFFNINYLVPTEQNLRLLFGKDISFRDPEKELSERDYKLLNAILVFDLLINKLLFNFKYLNYTKIDVRNLLNTIYSLVYSLLMIEMAGGKKIESDFVLRIDQLRMNWFENNSTDNLEELISLYHQSNDLILEIVVELNNIVKKQFQLIDNDILFKNRKYNISFKENWDNELFLKEFKKGYIFLKKPFSDKGIESFKFVLPYYLSYFLVTYANYEGLFSEWIKKGLTGYQYQDYFSISKGVKKHIMAVNDFTKDSIDNNGVFKLPFPYGLLINKRTLISIIGEKYLSFLRIIK